MLLSGEEELVTGAIFPINCPSLVGNEIGPMSYGRRDMRLDPAKLRTLSNALPGLF